MHETQLFGLLSSLILPTVDARRFSNSYTQSSIAVARPLADDNAKQMHPVAFQSVKYVGRLRLKRDTKNEENLQKRMQCPVTCLFVNYNVTAS